mgnify:FL=1
MKKLVELKKRLFVIVGGLVLVMILIVLLFNLQLMSANRQRTRQNNQRNLQMYMITVDRAMENIEDMLIAQDIEDVDLQNIRKPRCELDRYLSLLEKRTFFKEEIGKYRFLDGLFLFDKRDRTYIGVKSENVSAENHTAIKNHCAELVSSYENSDTPSEWMIAEVENEYYIFRMMNWKEIYYCAWLKPENMVADLQGEKRPEEGIYFLSDKKGTVLNQDKLLHVKKITGHKIQMEGTSYEVFSESQNGRGGLTLSYVQKQDSPFKAAVQLIIPVSVILIMGGFSLFLVLVLTSEMVLNPLSKVFLEEERKKNQAQLQFLQIQTNPHFLNNCLSLIRNLILLNRNREAEKVTLALGKFTRGYLNTQTEILLKNEIEQVVRYYEIQKMRYGERLKLDIYMDEDMENILVPAMSILTFVENAVKHQMKQKETLFILIWVRLQREKNQVFLRVQDNGTGFTQEILTQLRSRENGFVEKEGEGLPEQEHIGIKNLMQRMKILYGEQASLCFENADTQGAVITVILPERRVNVEKTVEERDLK